MPFKDPEARKAYDAKWRAKHRARLRQVSRGFRARHLERTRAAVNAAVKRRYHKTLKHNPLFQERNRARAAAWYEKNAAKAKKRIASYRRNAVIVPQQTPKWANRFFISEIYDLAKLRTKHLGIPHEVDHIVPLRGKNVCGLHVQNNLQVVPKAINRAKGNSLAVH